jgi:hypothetical protein
MALEINEIGIHLQVQEAGEQRVPATAPAGPPAPEGASGLLSGLNRDEIVEECVRRVLQALKTREER